MFRAPLKCLERHLNEDFPEWRLADTWQELGRAGLVVIIREGRYVTAFV